jgi:hypothetical protein
MTFDKKWGLIILIAIVVFAIIILFSSFFEPFFIFLIINFLPESYGGLAYSLLKIYILFIIIRWIWRKIKKK